VQGSEALLNQLPARSRAVARAAAALRLISVTCAIACAACSDRRDQPAATPAPVTPTETARDAVPHTAPAAEAVQPAAAPERHVATDPTAAPTVDAATLFERPIIIGASASAGFGISLREHGAKPGDGVGVSLADILRVAHGAPRTVEAYSSSMAFANPGPILSGEMQRALRHSPSVVIGIDFLFWYVYGTNDATGAPMGTREQRLANTDRGLAQMDLALAQRIPVIVGDIPDMKAAIGKMLGREQVPDASTLDAVNARIREWASSRPGARVFSLRESVMSISTNGSMRAGGTDWSVDDHGPLLLRDELHPSFAGLVAVASAVIESAATLLPEDSRAAFEASFEFDPMWIRRRLLDERARELDDVRSRKSPDAAAPQAAPAGAGQR
jgi:lysophospholipase L1-like esterase